MTFLELCQELARKAAISGTIVSVDGQVGEAQRVVNWIAEAYELVQAKNTDWTFLRADAIFAVGAPVSVYLAADAGVAQFGEWRFADGWRCYSTAAGVADEQPVRYCKYDAFRNRYQYASNRLATGRPQVVTEGPDQALHFWPVPDAAYTIVGEQFRAPYRLIDNGDAPVWPAKFHRVLVYRALMLYGEYEGDASVYAAAQTGYNNTVAEMERHYLPEWDEPEPMA